jgi:hypothetical protein
MSYSGSQSPPFIEQSGAITPGHVVAWTTDGVAQDAGTPLAPFATTLGLLSNSLTAFGIANAPVTGACNQVALGFDAVTGNAALSVSAFNGAQEVAFEVIVNGVTYPFPGAGGGNVVGPPSSTGGDVALFNGGTGALLKDGGNAKVTGTLTITTGARGSGNADQATILNDFTHLVGGDEAWQFIELADGTIIQTYKGTNTTGIDFITFPSAFPNACSQVIAISASPLANWGAGPSPLVMIMGVQDIFPNEFALYVVKWSQIGGNWIYTGGLNFRYIAIGY